MQKIFLLFSLAFASLNAGCFRPEVKVSYYHFSSSHVREIIGSGTALVQGELNYRVNNFTLFADAGYFSKRGHSTGTCHKTRLEAVPFSFGAKYNCGLVYVGGGLRAFSVNIHNDYNYVRRHEQKTSVGGVVNAGLNYCWNRIVFNPFFEYSFIKMNFGRDCRERNIYRHSLDLSGFSIGAGVGYSF